MNIKLYKLLFLSIFLCAPLLFCKTDKSTLLMSAVKSNDEKLVEAFIADGVDVNKQSGYWGGDYTVLMAAVENGYLGIAKKLIKAGADVNAVDGCDFPRAGEPVLYYAIKSGLVESVNLLIKSGVDVNTFASGHNLHGLVLKGLSRNIPLLSCAIGWHVPIEIVQVLIKAGADVNQHGWLCFWTPLMIAASVGNTQAVKALLDAGADKAMKNNKDNDKTALDYAKETGRLDIIAMLQ